VGRGDARRFPRVDGGDAHPARQHSSRYAPRGHVSRPGGCKDHRCANGVDRLKLSAMEPIRNRNEKQRAGDIRPPQEHLRLALSRPPAPVRAAPLNVCRIHGGQRRERRDHPLRAPIYPVITSSGGRHQVTVDLQQSRFDATINPDFGQVDPRSGPSSTSPRSRRISSRRNDRLHLRIGGVRLRRVSYCFFCSNVSSLSLFYSRPSGRSPQLGDYYSSFAAYTDIPNNTRHPRRAQAHRTDRGRMIPSACSTP